MIKLANTVARYLIVPLITVSILQFSPFKPVQSETRTMNNNINPIKPINSTKQSLRLAKSIQSLDSLQLPDEWEYAKGNTLEERFEATSKLMNRNNSNASTAQELMVKYENNGKPFIHSVWFNRPLFCEKCQNAGADGYLTVVSIKHKLYTIITAEELHIVTKHNGTFPKDKLHLLEKILFAQNNP